MAAAMILVRNTAMRASDVRKFPWTRYNGEQVQIRSSKTGKLALKAHRDGLTRAGAPVMLTTTAEAYTKRYFNEHWREDADKVDAGGPQLPRQQRHSSDTAGRIWRYRTEIAEAMIWTVDKAQKVDRQLPRTAQGVSGQRYPEDRGLSEQGHEVRQE